MHFYLFLRSVVSFILFNAFISSTLSQSLPKVRTGPQSPIIYPVGANVHIQCPVYEDQTGLLFFEWGRSRDVPIQESSRVRVTDKGVLKIKWANVADSGVYFCKAINGFGTVTTNVTLQIVPKEELQALNSPEDNLYPRDDDYVLFESNIDINYNYKSTDTGQGVRDAPKPVLIKKSVGFSVVMTCSAHRVRWYKNGEMLRLRHLPKGSHKNGGILTLSKVRLEDTGNYTCVATDKSGQSNNTFNLIVYDNRKPELTGFDPINSSVVLGNRAMFHCKVYSAVKPHIQWLKSYKNIKTVDSDEAIRRGLIRIHTDYYKVLKSSQVVDSGDGNYFNNLVIERTQLSDSGNYICLAANTNFGTFGFTYKSTYLTVLPSLPAADRTTGPINSNPSFMTYFWIVIVVISTIVFIFVVILWRMQTKPNGQSNNSHLNNNNTERGEQIADESQAFVNNRLKQQQQELLLSQGYSCGSHSGQLGANCVANRPTYQT